MNGKRLTKEEFITQAIIIHGERYNYDKVIYVNNETKIEIICKLHGSFYQTPHCHRKHGCPTCGGSTVLTTKSFVEKAISIHGIKYGYDKVDYVRSHTPIEIICPQHGSFYQRPNDHLGGNGCRQCYNDSVGNRCRSDTEEFIKKAIVKHDGLYNYSKTIYVRSNDKITIVCSNHGVFYQTPNSHLAGQGCPKCGKIISQQEIIWLNVLGVPDDKGHRQVRIDVPKKISRKKYVIADGFVLETKTIYEYLGDFWHGNPQLFNSADINSATNTTFGELYQKTAEREKLLKDAGYNVVSIWESEWEMQCRAQQLLSA